MAEETNEYLKYFEIGKRIGLSMPLAQGRFFQEWGVIRSFPEEDLIEFQLSRDQLPPGVKMSIGTILELRTIYNNTRYSCRGIIVDGNDIHHFLIRLIGEVILDEVREYYRLDVFLPLTYTIIPPGSPLKDVKEAWQKRLEERNAPPDEEEVKRRLQIPLEELEQQVEEEPPPPPTPVPIAANISGGGLRIRIPDKLKEDDLLEIELYIPTSPASPAKILDIIGQVVHVNPNPVGSAQQPLWITAIRFMFIDERDRDNVIRFISWEQLQRIRQMREKFFFETNTQSVFTPGDRVRRLLRRGVNTVIFLFLALLLAHFLMSYYAGHDANEIGKTFEQGIREYLQKFRSN